MAEEQGHRTILEVAADFASQRLDEFVAENLDISRSQAQKLIKTGRILIEGQPSRPKDTVKEGQEIWLYSDALPSGPTFRPAPLDLSIVYEDEDLMVLNKAAGVVVHPGAGTGDQTTLIEGIVHYLNLGQKGAVTLPGESLRPGIVHRLDKDTSGVMVVAKNSTALASLASQFKEKTNLREYVALVDGFMTEEAIEVQSYLYRDPRHRTRYKSLAVEDYKALDEENRQGYKYAKSNFFRRRSYGRRFSLVQVRLDTGRTHQIRVHSKLLRMPILGDDTYGQKLQFPPDFPGVAKKAIAGIKRQMLHAKKLGFTHPRTGKKLGFEVPLPEDFKQVVAELESIMR
ncbi:RluA family pseudouridine synthase [Pseudobacteriovorax antillogorgiicola]|uniref:Pseudouridine synthase n=1 Tax=Pseudobacteriovorax antillogorgiicola TaxID=1513793 RepID=A0A1Y6B6A8_9BACT|nr:RluA family pseudouridine synthase [Pseudobacteriovorax antillogorgiicola]TCS58923.1 ribosomal large subunit pseudouridine synthase D [Pseudobacteriovorax antillogorgiicola]SME93086.1 ribosomal large subunit pseudouridine synthase D [Pseudobacteriovorax antillogorgiicola]